MFSGFYFAIFKSTQFLAVTQYVGKNLSSKKTKLFQNLITDFSLPKSQKKNNKDMRNALRAFYNNSFVI